MPIYDIVIYARKVGSIGIHGTEKREYMIEAKDFDHARDEAIKRAYAEDLEHVNTVVQRHQMKGMLG